MDKNYLINNGVNVDKSLELFGDIDTYNDTLREFLNGINQKLLDLKTSKEASDTTNYAIYAHSLKSDARYLGFTVLSELALNHEMAGKNNDINYIYENYDNLINETNRIIKVVDAYLGVKEDNIIVENVAKDDKTIIVVDDSDIVTNFVSRIFENRYNVLIAKDGQSAINYIKNADENLIGMFLDLNMPNVNGFEVLDFMLSNNLFDKVPVTIITGADTKDEITRTLNYPVLGILSKPFNERDVKSFVEKMLNNYN